jgi:hypothetical protein
MLRISCQYLLRHLLFVEKMTGIELYPILHEVLVMLEDFDSEVDIYHEHGEKRRNNDHK